MLGINNLIANAYMVITEVALTVTNASDSAKAAVRASQAAVGGATGAAEVAIVAGVRAAQDVASAAGAELSGPLQQVVNGVGQAGATLATGGVGAANLATTGLQLAGTAGGAGLEALGVEAGSAMGMVGGVAGGAVGNGGLDVAQTLQRTGAATAGAAGGAVVAATTGGDQGDVLRGAGAGGKLGIQVSGVATDLGGAAPPAPATARTSAPADGSAIASGPDDPGLAPATADGSTATTQPDDPGLAPVTADGAPSQDELRLDSTVNLAVGLAASAAIYKRAQDTGQGDASRALELGAGHDFASITAGATTGPETASSDGHSGVTTVGHVLQQGGYIADALNYTELEARAEGYERSGMDASDMRRQSAGRAHVKSTVQAGYRQSIAHTDRPEKDPGFTLFDLWKR